MQGLLPASGYRAWETFALQSAVCAVPAEGEPSDAREAAEWMSCYHCYL